MVRYADKVSRLPGTKGVLEQADFVYLGLAMYTPPRPLVKMGLLMGESLIWMAGWKLLRLHPDLLRNILRHAMANFTQLGLNATDASGRGTIAEKAIALGIFSMTEPGKHLRYLVQKTAEKSGTRDLQLPAWCVWSATKLR